MLFIHLSAFSLRDEIRKAKRREVIWLVQILTSLSIITQFTFCSHPQGSHKLTNAWLVSLNRVKSWLVVSNSALQINSNHSRRGPPQSRAEKDNKNTKWHWLITFYHFCSFIHHFILSDPSSLHSTTLVSHIPTHLNSGHFFFNPTSFCRIKGIPITKLMPSSEGTQIRDPRNWCFSWYYKGYSALLLQTPKSSPSKSLSICALQAQSSHRASKHHPFGLDSWLLFPKEKEAGAGVASMCRRAVFSFCGCSVRRQGGVGRRVKKDEWEISKLTFFILKNHFKVLAPIWDGKIPSGFQRLKSSKRKEIVRTLASTSWVFKTKTQEHYHCPFNSHKYLEAIYYSKISFNNTILNLKCTYLQKKFKIKKIKFIFTSLPG